MATASRIGTVTVNAAFLQEIKEVHLELWELLREVHITLSEPVATRYRRRQLVAVIEQLRDQLALHFALEEAYGYFEDPAYVAPRLCKQAMALRAEHRELYESVCCLVEQAARWCRQAPGSVFQARLVSRFSEFEGRFRWHEARENAMIHEEYGDDIRVGD